MQEIISNNHVAGVKNPIRDYFENQQLAENKKAKESQVLLANERSRSHYKKKKELGGRVQVCRILIQRYYNIRRDEFASEDDYIKSCEAVLDNVLVRYEYNIELIIDKWKDIVPKLKKYPDTCKNCGYKPPFCGYAWESACNNMESK